MRNRRALEASAGSLLLRITSVGATLVTTAIATRLLSPTDLAIWFVMISLVAFQGVADLGVMSRLTTSVAEIADPLGAGLGRVGALFYSAVRSSIVLTSSVIGGALVAVGVPTFLLTGDLVPGGAVTPVGCFSLVLLLTIPLQGPLRILHGLQRGSWANLAMATSYVALTVLTALLWALADLSLPWFVVLSTAPGLVAGLFGLLALHLRTPVRISRRSAEEVHSVRTTATLSAPYLVIAVSSIVAFSSDLVVLAIVTDSDQVASYATSYRLFTQVPITTYALLSALWPAAADARIKGDVAWTRTATGRTWVVSVGLTALAAVPLLLFGRVFIDRWTGGAVAVSTGLLIACAVYSVINAAWSPLHFTMLGQGMVTFMARCMAAMAVVNIVVSVVLAAWFGAVGPVVGSALSLGLLVLAPYAYVLRQSVFSKA